MHMLCAIVRDLPLCLDCMQSDGAIALWDLRESASSHRLLQMAGDSWCVCQRPTFSTGMVCTVVSLLSGSMIHPGKTGAIYTALSATCILVGFDCCRVCLSEVK